MKLFDSFMLKGQVAVVTGGARDLGFDMASALAEAGSHLVITSRDLSAAQAAGQRLRELYGVEVLPLAMDQREHAQTAAMARQAAAWKGRIDVLVNNAGGNPRAQATNLFERAPEDIADLIALNLTGALYCCREIGPVMARQRRGKIINIASMAGLVGRDRRMYDRNQMREQPVEYAAAKAGVIGMTLDLAGLLGPDGVCVNCISPGGFQRGQPAGFIRDYSDRTPLGRMGRDGYDLKGAVVFLASAAADYITGQNLVVDGGFSIWR